MSCFLVTPAFAWVPNGNPIATSPGVEWYPVIAADGSGGCYVVWTTPDGRIGVADLDGEGRFFPGWPDSGLRMSGGRDPDIDVTRNGEACLVSTGAVDLYFARIEPPGPPKSRAASAMRASSAHPPQVEHEGLIMADVAVDSVGGAFVAFTDNQRSHDNAYLRHHDAAGAFTEVPLQSLGCCFINHPVVCSDGAGGAFVAWNGANLLGLQRVRSDLIPAAGWEHPVTLDSVFNYHGICPDGAGGVYVFTQSREFTSNRLYHYSADRSPAEGWSAAGVQLTPTRTFPGITRIYFDYFTAIVPDGHTGALCAWVDQRADTGDVYVQRILADGSVAPGWTAGGVPAGIGPGLQQNLALVADGAGGAIVAWQDERNSPHFQIRANWVRADGTIGPGAGTEGVVLSGLPGYRMFPRATTDEAGGAYVTWIDERAGNPDIYAARFTTDAITPVLVSLVSVQVAADRATLVWDVAADADRTVTVERCADLGSWQPVFAPAAADGRVTFVDRDVAPGSRYGYRIAISSGGSDATFGETWLTIPRTAALSLAGLRPNPAVSSVAIAFSLPDAGAARLELIDAAGRLVWSREVGALGPGEHLARFDGAARLAAGVYWLRLTRGARMLVARGVVLGLN